MKQGHLLDAKSDAGQRSGGDKGHGGDKGQVPETFLFYLILCNWGILGEERIKEGSVQI